MKDQTTGGPEAATSRRRLLDAALAEFAEKGYAGATVRAIAARAGVNTQLISYYFGGKAGLHRELLDAWREREAGLMEADSFAAGVTAYLRAFAENPDLLRMFVREGLSAAALPAPAAPADGEEEPEVAQLRRLQAEGGLAADLDPAYLAIVLMGATTAMVTVPAMIERLCGVPADSPEFLDNYAEQLRRIIEHLSG
ncbi:TetR/AcrR family transcriptional regulator [Glycomyces arizonensis]|uniref:TetR/AcrR family transcriptional regulator n=1 Tax=Glycomyces arizonensis TaxID=256035 RepID=UPI0004026093|nr:TetR/AcrR family transcriptional regulator [Glycomyces arizonensis]